MCNISLALTAIEDTLELKATSLIDPSLLKDTPIISLPIQVDPLTEDNLNNAMLYTFLKGNIEAYPECKLADIGGRIDIIAKSFGCSVGIECKEKLSNMGEKDHLYSNSEVLNALYFASFAIGDYELELDNFESTLRGTESAMQLLSQYEFAKRAIQMRGKSLEEVVDAMRTKEINYEERAKIVKSLREKYEFGLGREALCEIGVILYNPLGKVWIAKRAEALPRRYVRKKHQPTKEAFIKFSVWRYFKDQGYIVASECNLPNAKRRESRYIPPKVYQIGEYVKVRYGHKRAVYTGHNRIDITAMPRKNVNSMRPQIIGVECKPSASKTHLSKLKEQLLDYKYSGDLSHIYVAIPDKHYKPLLEFLCKSGFDDIGVLRVNTNGSVEKIKEAELLRDVQHIGFINFEKRCVSSRRFKERLYVH